MNFSVYSASKGMLYISAKSKVGMAVRMDTLLETSRWHRWSRLGTILTNSPVAANLSFDSCSGKAFKFFLHLFSVLAIREKCM